MTSYFDVRELVDYSGSTYNSGDVGGRMRRWEPVRFGIGRDSNRIDLWEDFEKKPPKFIKNARGKMGIFAGILTLGAMAAFSLTNKFNTLA